MSRSAAPIRIKKRSKKDDSLSSLSSSRTSSRISLHSLSTELSVIEPDGGITTGKGKNKETAPFEDPVSIKQYNKHLAPDSPRSDSGSIKPESSYTSSIDESGGRLHVRVFATCQSSTGPTSTRSAGAPVKPSDDPSTGSAKDLAFGRLTQFRRRPKGEADDNDAWAKSKASKSGTNTLQLNKIREAVELQFMQAMQSQDGERAGFASSRQSGWM